MDEAYARFLAALLQAQLLGRGQLQLGNDGFELVDHKVVGGVVLRLVLDALKNAHGAVEGGGRVLCWAGIGARCARTWQSRCFGGRL